jgi:hypothetical protein
MVGVAAPFGGLPTRFSPDAGDSGKVAIVLPGSSYSPAHPLLEFGRQALLQHGWTVQQVWWDQPETEELEPEDWVTAQAVAALVAEVAERFLLMGKSLGTMAAGVAARRNLPAVWLTPLLTRPRCVEWHRAATQPALLVGGSADPSWDGELARQLSDDVLELADATHFAHVPNDAVRSAELHVDVARAVDAFLTRIG